MAARYRKIDPRIWVDERFRRLSLTEQLIAMYVLTAQANRIGIFSFSPGRACEDLKTFPQTFRKGFGKVCQALGWEWDKEARVLFIPTWWKYNLPDNPNVLKSCLADLHDIPKTPLLTRFSDNFTYLPETFHQTFQEGFPKPSPKPMANQEQEQEQEQEQDKERCAATNPSQSTSEEIRQKWNSIPGVKPCKALGSTITDRIRTRLREHPDPAWWENFFHQVQASNFLCGRINGSHGPYQAALDWALSPSNLDKILAGNYDNHNGKRVGEHLCQQRVMPPDGRFLRLCGKPAFKLVGAKQKGICVECLKEVQTSQEPNHGHTEAATV